VPCWWDLATGRVGVRGGCRGAPMPVGLRKRVEGAQGSLVVEKGRGAGQSAAGTPSAGDQRLGI
jgi:hypothetical protein